MMGKARDEAIRLVRLSEGALTSDYVNGFEEGARNNFYAPEHLSESRLLQWLHGNIDGERFRKARKFFPSRTFPNRYTLARGTAWASGEKVELRWSGWVKDKTALNALQKKGVGGCVEIEWWTGEYPGNINFRWRTNDRAGI